MFRIGLDRDISNSIAIRYTYYMRNAIVNAHFGTDVATRCSIHISSHWSWQWCQPGSMHICIETQQAYIYSDGALRARKYSLALWRGSFAVCPKSIRAKRLVVRVLVARTSEMWVYFMFVHRVWGLCWLVGGLWLKCEAPRLAINLPNKSTSWPICVRCCLILLHMDVCMYLKGKDHFDFYTCRFVCGASAQRFYIVFAHSTGTADVQQQIRNTPWSAINDGWCLRNVGRSSIGRKCMVNIVNSLNRKTYNYS